MNTNYSNDVVGALKLLSVNGSIYQIGKDASNTEGGIVKLFNDLETYAESTDGAYNAAVVYNELDALKTAIDLDNESSLADRVTDIEDAIGDGFDENSTVAAAVAAAKSTVAAASGDYITVTPSTDSDDNHIVYTIGTTGIDTAISTAVTNLVNGAPETLDTLGEIATWIANDETGTAALIADVATKASKVNNAVSGNFASLDANGDLVDSGHKHSDYKTQQTAVADPTTGDSTSTYEFIASISQNANGEITATKEVVRSASASQSGLMSAADFSKLSAVSATVSGDTLFIVTQAAA